MKSNYDRSKTIVCKTTKNYHLHADNLLLIICRKKRLKAIYQLCTENLPYPTDWSIIFSCLSLKIAKLAFHWRWIFPFVAGLHVSATLMVLPEYILVASNRQVVNGVITQNYVFFPLLARPQPEKCFLKKGEKKEYNYSTLRF